MSTIDVPIRTIEQLLAIPEDGKRHEMLEGEYVVTPNPRVVHQLFVEELGFLMKQHVQGSDSLCVLSVGADVFIGSDTLVEPDLCVFRFAGLRPSNWRDFPVPVLVVEVLSPGTASRDRGKKREIYQKAGVAEYWIVDIDARIVERWRPEDERPEIVRDVLTWLAGSDLPELKLDIAGLFSKTLQD